MKASSEVRKQKREESLGFASARIENIQKDRRISIILFSSAPAKRVPYQGWPRAFHAEMGRCAGSCHYILAPHCCTQSAAIHVRPSRGLASERRLFPPSTKA